MFDGSRATEGYGSIFFGPSSDFYWNSPELFEKGQTGATVVRALAPQPVCNAGMPACREVSEDESSEVCGGLVPDGEEDLEALLCYIDGDEILELAPEPVVSDSHCEVTSKRKRSSEEVEDDEEVQSKLCSRPRFEVVDALHEPTSPDVSADGRSSAVTQPPVDGHKSDDELCLNRSADELQMLCDDFGYDMPEQQCSSCSPDLGGDSISSGSARYIMRQKIKETVQMLREAIPGGKCLDTAVVLDETINYVKLLQLQVQALGAQRLAQRAGR